MKKIILATLVMLAFSVQAQAQTMSKNALGLRFGGDGTGSGVEFSYQRKLSTANRLELDLGMRNNSDFNAFKVTGLYEWVWKIDGGFNWYLGAGAGIGSWSEKNGSTRYENESTGAYGVLNGDAGIEYNFDFPIQIALDFRPGVYFGNYYNTGYQSDLALSVRYRF